MSLTLELNYRQPIRYLPAGQPPRKARAQPWSCSNRLRKLILKLTAVYRLDKVVVDDLAREQFGHGVRQLNPLEASALIDELLACHAGKAADAL